MTEYEKQYTQEQKELANKFVTMEKSALDKWFKGDISGYWNLWSETNFSYFDANTEHRIDTRKEIEEFLNDIKGKLFAKSYEFLEPRVQFSNDNSMGVLTYQLHADTSLIYMHHNCIEVFLKEKEGWHVVHSTWSFIKPMDFDWNSIKALA